MSNPATANSAKGIDLRLALNLLTTVLSSHDLPIAFLFGAGTSSAIRIPSDVEGETNPLIPAVKELTEKCKTSVVADATDGLKWEAVWNQLVADALKYTNRQDIEAILSRLRMVIAAIPGATFQGASSMQLERMEKLICGGIAKEVNPKESEIPTEIPHDHFARWIKKLHRTRPIEVFTVNYDILIERSLEAQRVPIFDGFVGSYRPYFDASVFDRDNDELLSSWLRLWKLHGSINWSGGNGEPIIRGEVKEDGQMIMPSHFKYEESKKMPYRAMQDKLGRVMSQKSAVLVVQGYAFGDDHINEIILSHAERSGATILALMFSDPVDNSTIKSLSKGKGNFVCIAPTEGCIGGDWAPWDTQSIKEVAEDSLFKTLVSKDSGCNLGDFAQFGKLLARLSFPSLTLENGVS